MSYIHMCVGGPLHTHSHTHVFYALQTMYVHGGALRQAALSLLGREGKVLVSVKDHL